MKVLRLIIPISFILLTDNVLADSWNITQGVTASSNTDILQDGTSSNSVQAVNSINLDGSNSTVTSGSTQNLSLQGSTNLKLEQKNGASASSQSINRVYAKTVGGIQQNFTTNSGSINNTITLEQANGISNENKQSLNAAITADLGEINSLTQNLSTSGQYLIYNQEGGTSNVQAGNLIKSGSLSITANDVVQSHTADYATFNQDGTTNSIQAGNAMLMITGQSGGTLKQEFTSTVTSPPFIGYSQTSTTSSIQSMNYAGDEL